MFERFKNSIANLRRARLLELLPKHTFHSTHHGVDAAAGRARGRQHVKFLRRRIQHDPNSHHPWSIAGPGMPRFDDAKSESVSHVEFAGPLAEWSIYVRKLCQRVRAPGS